MEQLKVFLLDDDVIYLKQLEFYLKTHYSQFAIYSFTNSSDLLDKLGKGKIPQIVICDHFLEETDDDSGTGLSLLKKLRVDLPNAHFILHSGQTSIELALNALTEEIDDYVSKDGVKAFARLTDRIDSFLAGNKS